VAEPPTVPFAGLLRQLRTDAGMTQEQLAQRAGLSPRSISDLERGINHTARGETTRLLADALGLAGLARSAFQASAAGRSLDNGQLSTAQPAVGVAAATRTLPRDIGSFTGRETELRMLVEAVAEAVRSGGVVSIYAIGGMAGIGKTAFAVHAAHRLAAQFPDGQIFLPLHGHTPGQRPVNPADALASLLQTSGVAAQQIPPDLDARTRLWRDHLVGKKLLLLFDDAAGHEQVRPLLPGTHGSLVVVTSRRHLTALEDAQTISLDTLPPEEAAQLLIRMASRPGLSTADREVGEITRLCGYLPLAVGMLARQLHHHPAWTPAGLAAELAAARDRLGLMRAENVSVAAAFGLSYQDLTAGQQGLFRRLGLHPGTDFDAYTAAALGDTDLAVARRRLEALYDWYLLTEPVGGRYRFHDLVAEHARTLTAQDPETVCVAATGRLVDYYLQSALAADRHLARRASSFLPPPSSVSPDHVPAMADRVDSVTWMSAEQFNLHAVSAYAAAHDRPRHAIALAAAMHGFLRSEGLWDQALTLYRATVTIAQRAEDQAAQAGALADLGDMQTLTGDYRAATATHLQALQLFRDQGDQLGEANALNKLGTVQQAAGDRSAVASLVQALSLHRRLSDRLGEANDLNQLGIMQFSDGEYRAATASHEQALQLCRELGDQLGEANALNRLGGVQQATGDYQAAAASLTRALQLHRDLGYRFGEATVLSQLGAVQQATGDSRTAISSAEQALELYRALGYPLGEAGTLNNLGVVQQMTGDHHAAADHHARALALYREMGSRRGEAEALNNLGRLALASGTPEEASVLFAQALTIAAEIGSRPEEARALEGRGLCLLRAGRSAEAANSLRAALVLYQDMGSPNADRVRTLLSSQAP
jgi:tetratricopeptide (TPR) repeat protein/transcriptional regulator with XRE-family HTH domain